MKYHYIRILFVELNREVQDPDYVRGSCFLSAAIGSFRCVRGKRRSNWARRAPMANNEIIEVRQIYERADFSIVVQKEAVQKAAEGFEELSNAAAAKA
jgi:hypothetical protein